jgi:hypothetical protein
MDNIKIGLTGKLCDDFERIRPTPLSEQLPTRGFSGIRY